MNGPRWTIVWAPEGRPIATGIESRSARAAKKKAPMPYRRYAGEMYCELENPNAYVAVIALHSPGLLLGGSTRHESSPFESERDARDWAVQSVEVNRGRTGYERADIRCEIRPVFAKVAIPATKTGDANNAA